MNEDERSQALARVRSLLLEHGVSEEEIDRAEAQGVIDLLVADRLLVPGKRQYTAEDVSEVTAIPVDLARRLWRALGFADVDDDERAFTDLDVEAIQIFQTMVKLGASDVESSLHLARVVGLSMARIAEAEVSPAVTSISGVAGPGDSIEEADRLARLADVSLPAMAKLLEYIWRRHVQAATRRAMLLRSRGGSGSLPEMTVGFADMVGFTVLSQELSETELAAVVGRFEQVAHDTITAGGGRVVKMIGDEAMFVVESNVAAADIALTLAEVYADDELLSDVRVGMAFGPVLVQDGDFFGPVVNLASRAVTIAEPGSVLVSDELHDSISSDESSADRFSFRALRPRQLKDLGKVQLWTLRRPGLEPVPLDRRTGRRFQRVADVLPDFDELRERSERLIGTAFRSSQARSIGAEPERGDAEGGELEAPLHGEERSPT